MGNTDRELDEVQAWSEGLEMLHTRISHRFGRPEPRKRAMSYLKGLLGPVERKNSWQLAEYMGDKTPDGFQWLLATYDWDPDLVRDNLGSEYSILVNLTRQN